MTNPKAEPPIEADVPAEEGIDPADMADRVDLDPEEQRNYTDDHPRQDGEEDPVPPEPPDE
jgi:hypothetical protein